MSGIFTKGGGDKLNSLATLLLYVFRAKHYNKEYDSKNVEELVNLVKSKNTDIINLKELITNSIKNDIDRTSLLDSITVSLPEDSAILKKLKKLISIDLEEVELNKYLKMMSALVGESTKVLVCESLASQTTFNLNTKDYTIEEKRNILTDLHDKLAKLKEEDSGNVETMDRLNVTNGGIAKLLNRKDSGDVLHLKTGWADFNKAIGGHFITGEFVDVEALSHKNKTGFTLSLFLSMLFNNKIELKDGRRPMFLWLSLEDPLDTIIVKAFVYLWFRKHKQMPLLLDMSNDEIEKFFQEEIRSTGVEVTFLRINPDKFDIDDYKRMIRSYETLGYRVICTAVDYLEKSYTDGSKYNTGTIGSGLKNMVTKFRTFIQEKSILFITPWQISTEANSLLRDGTTDREFLPKIAGKSFTQGSKALVQELDVQLLIHLCKVNGLSYQAVQVQKLKRATYVDPKYKYMLIPFEKNVAMNGVELMAPLMEDSSASSLIVRDTAGDDEFDL